MKRRSLFPFLVFILILLTASITATAQQTPFDYDPDKIEPGTMYIYQFSINTDKFEPTETEKVYYKRSNKKYLTIETLCTENEDPTYADYRTYKLNWNYIMLEEYRYKFLGPKEEFTMGDSWESRAETDFNQGELELTDIHLTEEGKEVRTATRKFNHFPTFFYFTFHVDAWTAMRFYPFPKKTPDLWTYTGSKLTGVNVKYQGKETVKVPAGKILAHKFQFSGKGLLAWLFGKKAWLWLTAEDKRNYMVKYVNNNSKGYKPRIEFRLEKVKKVPKKEWERKVDRWKEKK